LSLIAGPGPIRIVDDGLGEACAAGVSAAGKKCRNLSSAPNRAIARWNGMAHKKAHLPTKLCAACERPFAWRKKWERDWENVKFCSDRCRGDGVKSSRQ